MDTSVFISVLDKQIIKLKILIYHLKLVDKFIKLKQKFILTLFYGLNQEYLFYIHYIIIIIIMIYYHPLMFRL